MQSLVAMGRGAPRSHRRDRGGLPLLLALLFVASLAPRMVAAGPQPEGEAAAVVYTLQSALIEAMKQGANLTLVQRRERLRPVVTATHDLPFIAHFALGRYWKKVSEAERERYVRAFTEMSVTTYADRFDGYSGESFRILASEVAPRGDRLVRTELVKSDGDTVSLDYLLRQRDGRWRIINVVAEGVSNLALKRAEYAGFVKRNGFDALMEKMQAKLAERLHAASQ